MSADNPSNKELLNAINDNRGDTFKLGKVVGENKNGITRLARAVRENKDGITKLVKAVRENTSELFIVKKDLKEVKETVKLIPKMYNMLDKFVGGMDAVRQEVSLLGYRVGDHEERLSYLETKQ